MPATIDRPATSQPDPDEVRIRAREVRAAVARLLRGEDVDRRKLDRDSRALWDMVR